MKPTLFRSRLEKAKGFEVPIGLWEVTDDDVVNLDRYEGYPNFYYKRRFLVMCDDGRRRWVFAYIMHEYRRLAIPSEFYIQTCEQGYKDFGFDGAILQKALEFTERRAV